MDQMCTNLFAYGTLMDPFLMEDLCGLLPRRVPARLRGYSRWCLKDRDYPAIVPDQAGSIDGVLYLGLPQSAWKRLDEYEGRLYERIPVEVLPAQGSSPVPAWTYVLKKRFRSLILRHPWPLPVKSS